MSPFQGLNIFNNVCYNHVIPSGFKTKNHLLAIIMSSLRDSKYKSQFCYNHFTPSGFFVIIMSLL
jgi:hypothetical protein